MALDPVPNNSDAAAFLHRVAGEAGAQEAADISVAFKMAGEPAQAVVADVLNEELSRPEGPPT